MLVAVSVGVVVSGATFYRIDGREAVEGGDVDAGAHLDSGERAEVFGGALVLAEPAVVHPTPGTSFIRKGYKKYSEAVV